MAKVGAQRAAELTGKSKSTIQRAMNTGKLSYEVDDTGRRLVDASELDRVYGIKPQKPEKAIANTSVEKELEKMSSMLEIERLKMRIQLLESQLDVANQQLDDLKIQRDLWQKQATQVLLTSQHSQKQVDEYREEIKARRTQEEMRRKQAIEARMKKLKGDNENSTAFDKGGDKTNQAASGGSDSAAPAEAGSASLWNKIKKAASGDAR